MIEAQLSGRLGNQLFEYAVCRTIAEKKGYKWYVDPNWWYGGDLIRCDLGVKDGEITGYFSDEPNQRFRPEIFDIPDFTQLQGYWQCERYFDRDRVKEWFAPHYPKEAYPFLKEFPVNEYCYINVRGTDQKTKALTLPSGYYDRAIKIMSGFNSMIKFVVVTDDVDFAKTYFPKYPVFMNDRDVDFCLFHSAMYVISSISTFVWWATYLNDYNVVIAPRGWFASQGGTGVWQPNDIRTHKFIWI